MEKKKHIPLTAYEREQLQKLKAYIDAHPEELLTMELLVIQNGLSAYKVKRGFVQLFGQSAAAYIRERRMARARELLLTTDKILFEIARDCGYKDISSFSRAFKQFYQFSPDEFRRQ